MKCLTNVNWSFDKFIMHMLVGMSPASIRLKMIGLLFNMMSLLYDEVIGPFLEYEREHMA